NEKTVTQFCRKLAAERPLKDIRDEYNYPKKKGIKDECSRLLEASTMKSRRGFAIQRLMNAMRQAHADGWRSEERFSRNAETDIVFPLPPSSTLLPYTTLFRSGYAVLPQAGC